MSRILVAQVAEQRCGLTLDDIVECVRMVAIAPLPGAEPPIEGVVDVRGQMVAVLDVRRRLGLPPTRPPQLDDVLVVARVRHHTVALRLDAALGVEEVEPGDVDLTERPPGLEHAEGVARTRHGLVLIHDLAAFLSWDEASRLDAAGAESGP